MASNQFPNLRILATGSSTLAATRKFRDSLTGRKRVIGLTPVLHEELSAFGVPDVRERLLRGGLPPALLAEASNPEFYGESRLHFWRDKQQRQIDFVLPRGRDRVDAIECKWKPEAFETRNLFAFRALYPSGRNFVVSPLPGPGYSRITNGLEVTFVTPAELRQAITGR